MTDIGGKFDTLTRIEDVWSVFKAYWPRGAHISEFERHVRAHRNGLDFGGRVWFRPRDVDNLLDTFVASETVRAGGPWRMLEDYPGDTPGYVVFIAEVGRLADAVFVGWCPADARGPADLLALAQYASPDQLAILYHDDATPEDMASIYSALAPTRVGHAKSRWFHASNYLDELLEALRARNSAACDDMADEAVEDDLGGDSE